MDLLALIIINIVIAVILYYVVSIRVMTNVKNIGDRKMLKEMENHISVLFETSENYLNLLDSKIVIIRNLLQKLDEKEKNLAKGAKREAISLSSEILNESLHEIEREKERLGELTNKPVANSDWSAADKIANEYINNDIYVPAKVPAPTKKNDQPTGIKSVTDADGSFLASLGRGVKTLFGVKDIEIPEFNGKTAPVKTNALDYTVGGNPFLEQKDVRDNQNQIETFRDIFDSIQGTAPPKLKDHINISIKAALKEVPDNSSKIDKVVFLLRKKFTPAEIAEEMGLATPEVELIRTFRLGRS